MRSMGGRGRPRHARSAVLVALTMVGIAAVPAASAASPAIPGSQGSAIAVADLGVTGLATGSSVSAGSAGGAREISNADSGTDSPKVLVSGAPVPAGLPTSGPNPRPNRLARGNDGARGFNGLSHYDQRSAGTGVYAGTQWSLEPPDQALCVGNGAVVEAVNNALAVYDTHGNLRSGPTALSQFFQLTPEVNRTTGVIGEFISDPKCIYDAQTNRFFLTELMEDNGNNPGATGRNFQLIAVSRTGDPTGAWNMYRFDTTNDGLQGTPSHATCPCFGDQPLIGADANGFYISTNEFSDTAFNGAQIYAMSKWALAGGGPLTAIHFDGGPLAEGISYSVQPATSPAGSFARDNGGTEFFLSALQFGPGNYDNRIAVWALTNTSSLRWPHPSLSLSNTIIGSEVYGQPSPAGQKPGPTPLGTSLGEGLQYLNTNDDRMNQAVYADGQLWGALNTSIGDGTRTGIAWFDVSPNAGPRRLHASMEGQGYVSLAKDSVFFPSVAVNADGAALMGFSVSGPDFYPSTGYVTLSPDGSGPVHVSGVGAAPDDGFSGYVAYSGGNVARWGDYSTTVVDAYGRFWTAAEYIPNAPRTALANWGTFITSVSP
jgi:hypothetical protein